MAEEKKPRAPRKPKASKIVEEIAPKTLKEEITSKEEIKDEITPKDEVLKSETLEEITPKEEIKETPKLKADAEPVVAVLNPENPQDLAPIQPILKEENPQSLEPVKTEIAKKEEKKLPEITEKKDLGVSTPKKEEITKTLSTNQAPLPKKNLEFQLKKLNPNLEDGKSKWSFRIVRNGLAHEVFRGRFVRAYKRAENYCTKYGLDPKSIQKIKK